MIYLFAGFLICLIGAWIFTGLTKPAIPDTDISCSKPFLGVAVQFITGVRKVKKNRHIGGDIRKHVVHDRKLAAKLRTLNPGDPVEMQMYRYLAEQISLILLVLFIGSIAGLLMILRAEKGGVLNENNEISRSEYGGMDTEAELVAGIDKKNGEISESEINYTVSSRKYSKEEADELFEAMANDIDSMILNGNDRMGHVTTSLNLPRNVDGYPFTINWECSDYEYLDSDGEVHNDNLEAPVLVTLLGDCIYEHKHWYLYRTVQICPQELTENELILSELYSALESADKQSESEYSYHLPTHISYGNILWSERIQDDSPVILILILLACVGISPIREAEVNSAIRKRSKKLLMDYPAFISKLTLYMSAGMSIRNAFIRMGNSYEKSRIKSDDYLGKEIIIVKHELELGVSELEVYTKFGHRCGNREYMKLSTLLSQNLRKGSADLLAVLEKESEDAFVLRKNEARKLGEEASTKLLLPMIMMLAIVMVIIMVPAYMSFSS